MLQIISATPDTEIKFGERASIAVMLDEDWQVRKARGEMIYEFNSVPSRKMRRIKEFTSCDEERPSDRNA